ncbi:MAG: hypothetical protein ABL963_11960 [Longimicrobiales bacterium]
MRFALVLAVATMGAPRAEAQTARTAAAAQIPRTPDGRPDLQGNWTNATLTPFQREEGRGPVYTPEEVAALEAVGEECPPNPGTVTCGRQQSGAATDEARLTGNEYNEIYWDRGSHVAVVDGEARTSLVTRPANGRIPALTPTAQARVREAQQLRSQFAQYDHPELRPLAERCFVFGRGVAPPMSPNGAYNNNYTIVQTADHVLIMSEMVHDVRVIRIGAPDPLSAHMRPWFGDSWGRWEGDELVVETTNLNPMHALQGGAIPSEHTKITERFRRADENTIVYGFTVEDPSLYAEPWGGEIPFEKFDQLLYEYACHEGNYSLAAVLSGARFEERNRPSAGR